MVSLTDDAWVQVLLDSLHEGFVLQDEQGRVLVANPAAARILGVDPGVLTGLGSSDPRWQAIHPDGTPWPPETHPAMLTLGTGEPQTGVVMGVRRPDDSLVWLEVTSRPVPSNGAGAVVTCFHDVSAPPPPTAAPAASRPSAQPTPDAVEPFIAGHVLLAEDDPVNRTVLVRMLHLLGVACDTVPDGEQAVSAVAEVAYDVVLMDVQMPVLDGRQATTAIRARENDRHLPILALTAAPTADAVAQCRAAGMDAVIGKPISLRALRDALAPYLAARASGAEVLEPTRLRDLVDQLGDAELVRQAVGTYLHELAGRVDGMQEAVDVDDRDRLRLLSHSLKSSSAMLGAAAMSRSCAELEHSSHTADQAVLRVRLDDVVRLRGLTAEALEEWAHPPGGAGSSWPVEQDGTPRPRQELT